MNFDLALKFLKGLWPYDDFTYSMYLVVQCMTGYDYSIYLVIEKMMYD